MGINFQKLKFCLLKKKIRWDKVIFCWQREFSISRNSTAGPSTPGRSGASAINRPINSWVDQLSSLKFVAHSYNKKQFCWLQNWIQNKTKEVYGYFPSIHIFQMQFCAKPCTHIYVYLYIIATFSFIKQQKLKKCFFYVKLLMSGSNVFFFSWLSLPEYINILK